MRVYAIDTKLTGFDKVSVFMLSKAGLNSTFSFT